MNQLRNFIKHYVELPEAHWNQISTVFEKVYYDKNTVFISEGEICGYFYFLEEGLVRYYLKHNQQDVTKFFVPAPCCITSRVSFLNETPSKENIQALENIVLWRTSLQDYNTLMELNSWRNFIRKLLNEALDFTEDRLVSSLTKTAEFRYLEMLNETPGLINRIPLKYLASYLGIASQSLSRIRKHTLKNHT